ncbi:MAG TPA: hypothetical protein VK895_10685, partial [Jiangellaceae bacterium]|nr:hypothetical protein [Jiangellaceae bacterium]
MLRPANLCVLSPDHRHAVGLGVARVERPGGGVGRHTGVAVNAHHVPEPVAPSGELPAVAPACGARQRRERPEQRRRHRS